MGYMSKKIRKLSEEEIDNLVIAHADDDSAWEKPIRVRRAKTSAVSLPAELASRAAFFARLHRVANVEEWLKRIIE
jgi:transposase